MYLDLGSKAATLIQEVFRDALRGVGTTFPPDHRLAAAVLEAVTPPRELEHVKGYPDDDGDTDDPPNLPREEPERHGLRCPYCRAVTWDGEDGGIRVVDVALRWHSFGYEHEDLAITGSYDNDGEYETDHYECESCEHPVALPDDVQESGW